MGEAGAGERIVVGVDGSAGGRAALVWALTTAARTGAEVDVVCALPDDPWSTEPSLLDTGRREVLRAETEARLRVLVAEVAAGLGAGDGAPGEPAPVRVTVVPGDAAEQLVLRAEGARLLVVGSRGRGALRSALLGSVALHCSAHAPCPVVVVPPGLPVPVARVVVGIDDTAAARAALAEAAHHARGLGAGVQAVLVCQPVTYWSEAAVPAPPVGETLETARRRAREVVAAVLGPGPHPEVEVVADTGSPAEVLLRRAADAGLLVVGSRSRSRLAGLLLGSVALHCVVHAPCPVLVVRPHGAGPRAGHPAAAGRGHGR